MVDRGWLTPRLRVLLPRVALESWKNFPSFPADSEGCPEEERWALELYAHAMMSGWPRGESNWYLHELDDQTSHLAMAVEANAQDQYHPELLPETFRHARNDQEIRPWMDYFAYWQAFQIGDYLRFMTYTCSLTDELPSDLDRFTKTRIDNIASAHQTLSKRWENRIRVFDWLSRMRTVMGASVNPERSFEEQSSALRQIAQDLGISVDQMRIDIRATLLQMWNEWSEPKSGLKRSQTPLLELLRQEIEYAVFYTEALSGQRVDFLDQFWSPPVRRDQAADLIDALPREEELARRDFPLYAGVYIKRFHDKIPEINNLDQNGLRNLIHCNWNKNRSLRRFVLAFRRLHEQLRGEQLIVEDKIIRQTERIEQFNLVVLHAERVMSYETRKRGTSSRYPDVRAIAKDSLNHILGRWDLSKAGFSATAQSKAVSLLEERAQLHELGNSGLRLVQVDEVRSGNPVANHLIAAIVNFVIARNYAAHHDDFDFTLVYPTTESASTHPGDTILESVLLVVLSILLTR